RLLAGDGGEIAHRPLEQAGLRGGGADAHVDDDLGEPGHPHDVVEAQLVLELAPQGVGVAGLEAGHRALPRGGVTHAISPPHLRQMRTLAPDGSTLYPMRVGLPHDGHTSATFDTGIGMSLSMMPPCWVLRVGRWLLRAMLQPSTMTLPVAGMARMTLPSLPRSLPVSTRTRSPLRIFRPAITGPRVRARRAS